MTASRRGDNGERLVGLRIAAAALVAAALVPTAAVASGQQPPAKPEGGASEASPARPEAACDGVPTPKISRASTEDDGEWSYVRLELTGLSDGGCALDPAEAVFSLLVGKKVAVDPAAFYPDGLRRRGITWFLVSRCASKDHAPRDGVACVVLRVERAIVSGGREGPRGDLAVRIEQAGAPWSPVDLAIPLGGH